MKPGIHKAAPLRFKTKVFQVGKHETFYIKGWWTIELFFEYQYGSRMKIFTRSMTKYTSNMRIKCAFYNYKL